MKIIFFHSPVVIAGRHCLYWTPKEEDENLEIHGRGGYAQCFAAGEVVCVPFNNVRYWRTTYDNQEQAAEQEVRRRMGEDVSEEEA